MKRSPHPELLERVAVEALHPLHPENTITELVVCNLKLLWLFEIGDSETLSMQCYVTTMSLVVGASGF